MSDEERRDAEYDGSLPESCADSSPATEGTEQTDGIDSDFPAPDVENHFNQPTHRQKSYDEALVLQRVLYSRILDPETPDKDRAALVVAWDRLEDRKRILRNRPLPGAYRPESKPKASRPSSPIIQLSTAPEAQSA